MERERERYIHLFGGWGGAGVSFGRSQNVQGDHGVLDAEAVLPGVLSNLAAISDK